MKKNNKKVILFKGFIVGAILGGIMERLRKKNSISNDKEMKFRQYYHTINQWLYIKNRNKTIESYLKNQGYNKIAIYGMGELGSRLYEELADTDIEIAYAIDEYPDNNFPKLEFCELNSNLKEVDVIIVTPVFDYEKIADELSKKTDYEIISLEDIVFDA